MSNVDVFLQALLAVTDVQSSFKMAAYAKTVDALRAAFQSGKMATLSARRHQLKRLIAMLEDNRDLFVAALQKDLHKPSFETDVAEMMMIVNEASHACNELASWMEPEKVNEAEFI